MIRFFSLFSLCLVLVLNISFSNEIKINGTVYNGEQLSVYPNVENTFIVEYSQGNMGRATCENSNFTVTSQDQPSFVGSDGSSSSNNSKLLVKINLKPNTPKGTSAKVDIIPMLSNGSGIPLMSFEIVSKLNPVLSAFELVDANLNAIKSGEAFKIRIKGTDLEDLIINLPKQVTGKIARNKGNEVILELKAGKNFKGLTIDNSMFALKQKNVKINVKAKPLSIQAK